MGWKIRVDPFADKNLEKLDHPTRKKIREYLRYKVLAEGNPRSKGKALTGKKRGPWRYRVGKYRILCRIRDSVLTVIVIEIGKRDAIYED